MAAYGALRSLTTTIEQIQDHPRPPISLDIIKINPLIQMVAFLMQFLDNYIIDDDDDVLERRMVHAAQEAEDIIESHIVDQIEDDASLYKYIQKMMVESNLEANISSNDDDDSLYRELEKVMHDLDSITKDVAAIKDEAVKKIPPRTEDLDSDKVMNIMDKLNGRSSKEDGTNTMAGSDGFMKGVMEKLIDTRSWIIVIGGMGGIGKTTLAKNIYVNQQIGEHFYIRGWATVSQEFDLRRILLDVLHCLKTEGDKGNLDRMSEGELGQKLGKSLYGRRYLIVMDDIWDKAALDKVKRFFPHGEGNEGSKVLITTRVLNVGFHLEEGAKYFKMPFLTVDESWNLLRRCVFGEQGCPLELEEIGEDIARKCKGLPLSIVVIGGLLAKSEQTQQHWQDVAKNLSSIVSLQDEKRCSTILKLSYNQLPARLKPCFLYMGMFREDEEIHVPTLIKLWVAEGFVKQETDAKVYLLLLILRNLILVRKRGLTGSIKQCTVHDLLRDLCITEAEKFNFFCTTKTTTHNLDHGQSWRAQRRIGIHEAFASPERKWEYNPHQLRQAVQSASQARTLICMDYGIEPSAVHFRLLRVMNRCSLGNTLLPVNSRHLAIVGKHPDYEFPSDFYRLWNLQTLKLGIGLFIQKTPVLDIWRMPQLRCVKLSGFRLTDPPEENGSVVLEKLETLGTVRNLRLGEEVVERIPNIKKLIMSYWSLEEPPPDDPELNNLMHMGKLEKLSFISTLDRRIEVTFPASIRKLYLAGTYLRWEEMEEKIGWLKHLQVLRLGLNSFVGPKWEIAEDFQFQSLKYLQIHGLRKLEQWSSEATNFPLLERLELHNLSELEEIPFGFGEIAPLREMEVQYGADSAVFSAKKILEIHDEYYGEGELQIKVMTGYWKSRQEKEVLKSLKGPNFNIF